ncbi:MAG: 7-carboxy-7-deazaguanine synthase [Litorimonas sp.]
MSYSVKEIFLTIQGEGMQAGIPAVFLRFSGCNLWSGLERDRAAAICKFCDTDFIGTDGNNGGKFQTAEDLAQAVTQEWRGVGGQKWVVCTGGEPLLQLDTTLIAALHEAGFKVAVETNGTIKAPDGSERIDWLCVSPKANAPLVQTSGDELKLVYPQNENNPKDFEGLNFSIFSLQPRDDSFLSADMSALKTHQSPHLKAVIEFCLSNPQWRISLQTHKIMGID